MDFIINLNIDPSIAYKFLYGFGVNDDYRRMLCFKSSDGSLELTSLINIFFLSFMSNLIGITLLAESRGIWRMNLKKSLVMEHRQADCENIFRSRLFPDWFDFPVEPEHAGAVLAATGIAVRNPGDLLQAFGQLFSGGNLFDLYGGIFKKATISYNIQDFIVNYRVFSMNWKYLKFSAYWANHVLQAALRA